MINVFYWPRKQRLFVCGHAVTKDTKHPLVCSAISAMVTTLANTADGFEHAHWVKQSARVGMENGLFYIRMYPKTRYFKRTRVAIGMAVGLLMQLADEMPDVVHFEVATGVPFTDDICEADFINGTLTFPREFMDNMIKASLTDNEQIGETDEKTSD